MDYCLAIFSVRTSTMQFSQLLNKNGIRSVVVETPKALSASCGVSVRFATKDLQRAKEVLMSNSIKNFVRFYYVNNFFGQTRLTPIG